MSETEREIEAREECARRGIDPDEICADGGVTAWMVVDQERWRPTNDLASELTAAKAECDNLRRTLGEKSRQMDAQIAALRSIASKAAARIEALEAALREIEDYLGYVKNEGKPAAVREANSHLAWKIACAALDKDIGK
jgi:phage shock protein A